MSSWGDDNDGTGTMIPVRRNDGHMFHGFKIRGISLIVRTLERTLSISKKHFRFDITLYRFQDRTPTTRGTFHDVGQLGEIWTNFEGEVEFQALAVQHLKRRSHQSIFSELIVRAFLKNDFAIHKRHYQTVKPVKMKCWWEPIKPHKHISLPAACLSETIWFMIWIDLI